LPTLWMTPPFKKHICVYFNVFNEHVLWMTPPFRTCMLGCQAHEEDRDS
jgi:hypothetical protein